MIALVWRGASGSSRVFGAERVRVQAPIVVVQVRRGPDFEDPEDAPPLPKGERQGEGIRAEGARSGEAARHRKAP